MGGGLHRHPSLPLIVSLDGYLSRSGNEHRHIEITGQESWQQCYKAALFELDANKVSDRIAEAETAVVTPARELFHAAGDNIEEEQAVDDAMYALHALRSALKSRFDAEIAEKDRLDERN